MTTKELLHQLVEQLPDEQLEIARATLANLNYNAPMSDHAHLNRPAPVLSGSPRHTV